MFAGEASGRAPTASGVSSLLTKPEFSQSQALLPVMQVLEDDTVMLHILDDAARQGDGTPSVRIGRENDAAAAGGRVGGGQPLRARRIGRRRGRHRAHAHGLF